MARFYCKVGGKNSLVPLATVGWRLRTMQLQATMRFDWLFATVSINSEVRPLAP
jgi:hypothetical protein